MTENVRVEQCDSCDRDLGAGDLAWWDKGGFVCNLCWDETLKADTARASKKGDRRKKKP